MLSVINISKSYTDDQRSVAVLRDISLTIETGEFVAIVGRSGSGKTTLLNVMSTLVTPDSGELYYHDTDLIGIAEGPPAAK